MARQRLSVDPVFAPDVDALPDPVVVVSAEGIARWANRAATRTLGLTATSWIGTNVLDLIHPDDQTFAILSLASVQGKDVGTLIELRVATGLGWRLAEVVGSPLEGGDIVLCVRDISDRRAWEIAGDQDARFRAMIQAAAGLTVLVRPDGTVDSASGTLTRVLGLDPEVVCDRPLDELVAPGDRPVLADAIALARSTGATSTCPLTVEVCFERPGSTPVPFELSIVSLVDDPAVQGLVISGTDLRRLRTAQDDLVSSEALFRALIENGGDIITMVDREGVVLYDSPSLARLLGYAPTERVGRNMLGMIHPDDLPTASAALAKVIERPAVLERIEVRVRHREGTYRWFEVSAENLLNDPHVAAVVANLRDITERKSLELELAHQAFHDALTGLPNRALLVDRMEHALSTRKGRDGSMLALLFVDLDDFKTVNDGLGHPAGDQILRAAAASIDAVLRPGDTAARLGGDEFAVLLPDLPDVSVAEEIGARLLEALAMPLELDGTLISIHASVGVAVSVGLEGAAELLRNADLAMYRAKRAGKGRCAVYEDGMHASVMRRMALKHDLRRALRAGEFRVHYQPIVELASGAISGVEALARWDHPDRGILIPDSFIPLAEETGLIVELGRQVLRTACADAARWQSELGDRAPAAVSVNLSPVQLQHPDVVADVAAALRDAGLAPSSLILEITETALIDSPATAVKAATALKELGVRIALDDFGTGYSSLSYLDRFIVDIVKIDKSFIDSISDDVPVSPLIAGIVKLGHALGLSVTAEGVEDAAQLAHLREIGCARAQGYYFARPMTGDDLEEMLSGWGAAGSGEALVPSVPRVG